MPIDEHNLAYAPPAAGIPVPRTRRELFARPSVLAGVMLLAYCLLHGAVVLVKYASFGAAPGWPTLLEHSARAVVAIGLIRSNRRYLPQLALALMAADAIVQILLVSRIEHFGVSATQATMMRLAQAMLLLFELLPFPLLLLGRPTPLRRRFAIGIFALFALFLVSVAILTVESSVWVKNHPPGSFDDKSGARRSE